MKDVSRQNEDAELQSCLRDVAGLGRDRHHEMSPEASPLTNAFFRGVPFDFQILGHCPDSLLWSFTGVIPEWSEKGPDGCPPAGVHLVDVRVRLLLSGVCVRVSSILSICRAAQILRVLNDFLLSLPSVEEGVLTSATHGRTFRLSFCLPGADGPL